MMVVAKVPRKAKPMAAKKKTSKGKAATAILNEKHTEPILADGYSALNEATVGSDADRSKDVAPWFPILPDLEGNDTGDKVVVDSDASCITDVAVAVPVVPQTKGIGAGDHIVVDLSTSCTKDVAVAKLLGWMRGPIRRRYVELTDDGITVDQMPYLHTLEGSLAGQLAEFRASAHRKLFEAFEASAAEDVMDGLEIEVNRCDELIYMAAQYMRDIDDELVKEQGAGLIIDKFTTQQTGVVHINLTSLHAWSLAKYSIGIVDDHSELCTRLPKDGAKPAPVIVGSIDENSMTQKLETAYATFGFLMAAYAIKHRDHLYGGRVNSTKFTETLETEIAKGVKRDILGQREDNVRKTLGRAAAAMNDKLRAYNMTQIDYLKAVVEP